MIRKTTKRKLGEWIWCPFEVIFCGGLDTFYDQIYLPLTITRLCKTQKCLHVLDVFVDYKPSSCHCRVIDYCNACINRWQNWLMKTVIDKTTLVSYNNEFNSYCNVQSNKNLFDFWITYDSFNDVILLFYINEITIKFYIWNFR